MAHELSAPRFSARARLGRTLLVSACSLPLILVGCAAEGTDAGNAPTNTMPEVEEAVETTESSDEASTPSISAADGTATANIDGVDYTFDLAFCAIGDEDTLVHGPGTSSAGEDAYLDIDFQYFDDSWHGEVRIDLGISDQFDSSDDFYVFTTYMERGDKLIANMAVTSMFQATGTYFLRGEEPGVDGDVLVDCG